MNGPICDYLLDRVRSLGFDVMVLPPSNSNNQ